MHQCTSTFTQSIRLKGSFFPLKCTWCTRSERMDSLGVVGQLFKLGEADPVVQALIDAYPEQGRSRHSGFSLNAAKFVPGDLGYYRYAGSLTTPPCTEGVDWYVLREIRTISQEQVNRIAALHNGFNHRPIQARNGRLVSGTGSRPSRN